MIIAVCQIKNTKNIEQNTESIFNELNKLYSKNIDIILFPEGAISGFHSKADIPSLSDIQNYLDLIQGFSAYKQTEVFLPSFLKKEDGIYNSVIRISAKEIKVYDKRGLTDSESSFFEEGRVHNRVLEIKNKKIGLLICREVEDSHDTYMQERVDFILWPTYWGRELDEPVSSLLLKNQKKWQAALFQSNYSENDFNHSTGPAGLSSIVDFKGDEVFKLNYKQSGTWGFEVLESKKVLKCYELVESYIPNKNLSNRLALKQKLKGSYDSPCQSICNYKGTTCQTCFLDKEEKKNWSKLENKEKEKITKRIISSKN
jgi:predicted amidohydrolase